MNQINYKILLIFVTVLITEIKGADKYNAELRAIVDREANKLLLGLGETLEYVFTDDKNYPPIEEDVKFYCVKPYTNTSIQTFVNDSNIDAKVSTGNGIALITHGWVSNVEEWALPTSVYWSNNASKTVCAIDWSRLAAYNYFTAAFNHTHLVADYIIEFIKFLNSYDPNNFALNKITIAGHSLGGQISGFVGQGFGNRIGQIFGIDPAGPGFTIPFDFGAENRLTRNDAINVQVIHTAAFTEGDHSLSGKSNYYPNGGIIQPGCSVIDSPCSHLRATILFTIALDRNIKFIGTECRNYLGYLTNGLFGSCSGKRDIFGIWTHNLPGKFYFATTATPPYVKN